MAIGFDDRVAIVAGAGAGLGRCHVLGVIASALPKTNFWAMHSARPRKTLSMQLGPSA